jgi:hypothetical protein
MRAAFSVHKLNDAGAEKAIELAKRFDELCDHIESIAGKEGARELAIARTKLEEACFFAKKAMAMNPQMQA